MKYLAHVAIVALAAVAGHAQAGDASAGQSVFAQRCATCHMIVSNSGQTIQKGGKTGPNLFGVVGRKAGSDREFGNRYGDALVSAGNAGLTWSEDQIAEYIEDPRAFLRSYLDDRSAQSRMSFRLNDDTAREDVAAFLASVR